MTDTVAATVARLHARAGRHRHRHRHLARLRRAQLHLVLARGGSLEAQLPDGLRAHLLQVLHLLEQLVGLWVQVPLERHGADVGQQAHGGRQQEAGQPEARRGVQAAHDPVHLCGAVDLRHGPHQAVQPQEGEPDGDRAPDEQVVDPRPVPGAHGHLEVDRHDGGGVHGAADTHPVVIQPLAVGPGHGVHGQEEDAQRVPRAVAQPLELLLEKVAALGQHRLLVQHRVRQHGGLRHVLLDDREPDDGQRRPEQVERRNQAARVQRLRREAVDKGEEDVGEVGEPVLVERVLHHLAVAPVRRAAVQQHQARHVLELRKGKVGGQHRRAPLAPADAAPDVRGLDHAHIIGAVPDAQRDGAALDLHQLGDRRLLHGAHAAAHHGLARVAQRHERVVVLLLERQRQRAALDDQAHVGVALHRARRACGHAVRRGRWQQALVLHADVLHLNLVQLLTQHLRLHRARARAVQLGRGALVPRRRGGHARGVGRAHKVALAHLHQRHVLGEEPAGQRDGDGGLHLVARQHPQPDAASRQLLDARGHAILQLVLDGRAAQQLQALLHLLAQRVEPLVAVLAQRRLGVNVAPRPVGVEVGLDLAVGQAQRAQARAAKVLHVRGGQVLERQVLRVAVVQALVDDGVGALAQQQQPAALVAHDDRLALARRVELEDVEHLVHHVAHARLG
mmetsp:Transcript_16698/g.41752  ORF Transcript_16698/g.41752 Transcript_16698/m.41752 type:complete len:678 (+) Transcript_16698:123-2156(+)